MEAYGVYAEIEQTRADFKDAKDNYLLDFSQTIEAGYLVTGDQNLFALENYFETNIISFRDFMRLLSTEN